MNSEPQSEVMWDGMPCFENTWVRNSWASSGESMELWVGMKRDCLVRQSTITNIAWQLFEKTIWFVLVCLGMCTYCTGSDVLFDHLGKSQPMTRLADQVNGFVMAKVTRHWMVMVVVD